MQCKGIFCEESVCQLWEDANEANGQMKVKAGGTGKIWWTDLGNPLLSFAMFENWAPWQSRVIQSSRLNTWSVN